MTRPQPSSTNFTEDAIFYYDWLGDNGQLIVSRGAKTRDIVLIRHFGLTPASR